MDLLCGRQAPRVYFICVAKSAQSGRERVTCLRSGDRDRQLALADCAEMD
jgi:hypothetical protein